MIKVEQNEQKQDERYICKPYQKSNLKKRAIVSVPGSKSITNRALLIAAMAKGKSRLKGCMTSEDACYFLECLKILGFPVTEYERKEQSKQNFAETSDGGFSINKDIEITGFDGDIPNKKAEIYVGSAGTAARFLVSMLAFSDGEYTVNSSNQMKKRPMQPLIESLRSAGAVVTCMEEEGHFPLHIIGAKGRKEIPNEICVNIDKSSQFLSALLVTAGALEKDMDIKVTGHHGLSYVDMTVAMMKSFGVCCEKKMTSDNEGICYHISGADKYSAIPYNIEPDMSAAAYFYALAAILGERVCVGGVKRDMLQGDIQFLWVLEKMGATVTEEGDELWVTGKGNDYNNLTGGFTIDMSSFSDQALTLAAIAPFANGPITITGIGHIRLQECDRIHAIVENLTRLGIRVLQTEDSVTIYPGEVKGNEIETFDDHRVAMAFALTGLKTNGVVIKNPGCCKKTFAEYFDVLDDVLVRLQE